MQVSPRDLSWALLLDSPKAVFVDEVCGLIECVRERGACLSLRLSSLLSACP